MIPTPQETMVSGKTAPLERPPPGDEVVISGMSGIFPSSDSIPEFMDNLYNKVDMVTSEDPRWVFNHPEVPKHLGKVNGMGKFDAQFFRVHYKQGCTMEPMSRKLLEHAYSAIYDSGINPLQLRGKKVGVFIGSTFSESEKVVIYENIQRNGFAITGSNKAMYANRISYWIDGKGPSYALDLASASSTACLEHAYRSISSGQCEAAIVGGCNLCMNPKVSLNCARASYLCFDGKTKCFDKKGDGYVRADAISVLFLQKAKDAKRIYTEVYHAKSAYSPASEQLIPVREPKELQQFFEEFYSEIGISPDEVEYVEANGEAFPKADINEMKAIGEVFAKKKPIKIGCVKSNMGSGEPASGICGITKICLAYHNGKLPGNLHYDDPLDIPEVQNKIQVLIDNENFNRGFAALNSFSNIGANVHVLMKGYYKQKDKQRYETSLPYLLLVSGRQDNCVQKFLDNLKKNPIDPEQIALLHNIHKYDIPGHMSRGYTLLSTNEKNETVGLCQSVEYCPGTTRPVWFVYSGMGSQWATMGAQLMKMPIFAAAIQKCHKVLEPKGVDIVKILTDADETIYENILHSFVGIAAVQIGLTDVLKEIGVVPDHIIGHSVGELGCAYADGCFTAEEMILSAYSRGLVSVQTPFIRGSMAAVGLGYKTVLPMCPPEIEVACHNSSESSTISGPADVMKEFVAKLTSEGIFAKQVPCSNIAYHSRYIAEAGPGLLKYLSEVIKTPKARSRKWVSTSVPQEKWNDAIAKYSSAEYHTNNLLNPVLFEETSQLIPPNALVIEIAPHGLLQAILKRSLTDCTHVPLTRRGAANPLNFLLNAFGKLYQVGLNLTIDVLYPKIEYPVSTGTPFLSHYVEWEHSEDWPEVKYNNKDRVTTAVRHFVMSVQDDEFKYFKGHVRDGYCVFPESAFLVLIWETLAMYNNVADYRELSVVFQDVQFHGEVIIKFELPVKLEVMIFKGTHKFEITYENFTIVSGYVSTFNPNHRMGRNLQHKEESSSNFILNSKDIYTMMCLKGYGHKDEFQSIHSTTSNRNRANIKWTGNWITYLDSLLQLSAFARNVDSLSVPSYIKKCIIDIKKHKRGNLVMLDKVACINADVYDTYEHTSSGGVEIDGLVFKDKPIVEQKPDVIVTQHFVPHFLTEVVPTKVALQINLQIINENVSGKRVQIMSVMSTSENDILEAINEVTTEIVSHSYDIKLTDNINNVTIKTSDLVVIENLLADEKKLKEIYKHIAQNTFIITVEHGTRFVQSQHRLFNVITAFNLERQKLLLLRKVHKTSNENRKYMPIVYDQKFSWVPQLQMDLQKFKKIILVFEIQYYCGLLGFVKKIIQEHNDKIGLIVVDDFCGPLSFFNPENDIIKDQIENNLRINIFKKGQWGGYYNISSKPTKKHDNIYLTSTALGDLSALAWIKKPNLPDTNNLVQVCYAGVTIRDANITTGNTNLPEQTFGMDFSGIDNRGEKVMGVVSGGAVGSTVAADPDLVWPVPAHWTLEDAATVPLAYTHAYYCLTIRSCLRKGSRVLINGGAGALTQAVVTICLSNDCDVYVSGCVNKQKAFLLDMFPELAAENVGITPLSVLPKIIKDVRNSDSYNIKLNSARRRCDIVINCLSGSMRKAAMQCVGINGTLQDTCNYDMIRNDNFGMSYLFDHKIYMAVNLNTIFSPQFGNEKKLIQLRIAEGIAKGIVRPLSRVTYSPDNVTGAFRMLSANKNRAQVLIRMKKLETINQLNVTTSITYCPKGTYIVVCDESLVSIELADRLVKGGARNLVIHIIEPSSNAGYYNMKFMSWNKLDVAVKHSSENLQTEAGCMNLLKTGAKLGSIRGIFIVHNFNNNQGSEIEPTDLQFKNKRLVIMNLDLTSRNVCNELDHFVILHHSCHLMSDEHVSSVIDNVCRARVEHRLPALVFHAGQLKEMDGSETSDPRLQPLPLSAMLNALETSLEQKLTNVIIYNLTKKSNYKFLQKLSKIIGVKSLHELDEKLSLKDLRLDLVTIEEINTAIKNTYLKFYPTEILIRMTVADLINLDSNFSTPVSNENNGLGTFFSYIDQDECMASEPVVTMPTSCSSVMEEEEMDPKATYLMLVPGFEGHHRIFTTVSERLKVQALTFQLMPDMSNDSIPQMADNIAKFMRKRVELKSKFYLLGFSFGVNVAFELARIFEKEGHVGVVYCLDSSPDALRAQLDAYIGTLTESQLQNTIVEHMYQLMSGRRSPELKQKLLTRENWNDKVELCVNKLRGLVKYSHQYKRCLLTSAYRRIILAREYAPDFTLHSQLVLIRGAPHPGMSELAYDYNLAKYTKQPVQIFNIEFDHATAHQDCRVSNIVNNLLEPKLLEEYKNMNLCWTYLAEPTKKW